MQALAEIQVIPMGVGVSVRDEVKMAHEILASSGLTVELHAYGTNVEGELDDISGFGQTEAAHQLCTSIPIADREHYRVPRVGHYGIFSGRRWRELIYPRVREFIRKAR